MKKLELNCGEKEVDEDTLTVSCIVKVDNKKIGTMSYDLTMKDGFKANFKIEGKELLEYQKKNPHFFDNINVNLNKKQTRKF